MWIMKSELRRSCCRNAQVASLCRITQHHLLRVRCLVLTGLGKFWANDGYVIARWTEAAVSFWSVQSPSQDEIERVWRKTNVLELANCFCIDLHCSNSAAHSVQQAFNPTCCECGVISRHITTRVCSLCLSSGVSAVVVSKCLVLCLCQMSVLFE